MAVEGVYSIVFQGVAGLGVGTLVLQNNKVTGADPVGGKYTGSYKHNPATNCIDINANVLIPPGTTSVTGLAAGNQPIVFPVKASIPAGQIGGHQHTVHTPNGNIVLTLTKVTDLP